MQGTQPCKLFCKKRTNHKDLLASVGHHDFISYLRTPNITEIVCRSAYEISSYYWS